MRWMRRTTTIVSAVLLSSAAGCGDDGAGGPPPGTEGDTGTAEFCELWNEAMAGGEDAVFDDLLARAPADIAEAAEIIRAAEAAGTDSPEAEAAAAEVLDWTELHCRVVPADASPRHVAPPADARFDGLTACGTLAFPSIPPDGRSGTVLYGADDGTDPYDGPMLGLLWTPAEEGGHVGDGESEPVTVRGVEGAVAPITVFQQTVLPELGTVVAWVEGDHAVGLYGRGWTIGQTDELLAIAEQVEATDDGFRLPVDALPDGDVEVFAGDPSALSIITTPAPLYSVRYQGADGILTLEGLHLDEDGYEAFRFLTTDVGEGDAGGRAGLVGDAWGDDGPAIATWREDDGLVVRVVGIGVPMATVLEVAEASRDLDDGQWAALVSSGGDCGL